MSELTSSFSSLDEASLDLPKGLLTPSSHKTGPIWYKDATREEEKCARRQE
ncbi:predicted protein [Sclerotinia sclerotiorum 1980 UF-70]|uniref:Uncharacterized protein n=1 Tax=Sclerotinia sclerotiorum (strain ATCC 18683 / 1980 / Ss-1) TaxID=665079 RepID=A7E574_SCLS1|nr:predicted protein [Sclerotinia sclerotiorum 1980 UF-70]EDN91046.1 predicted protein [Sclerotinia sclerotiorum 1980 UF-70]